MSTVLFAQKPAIDTSAYKKWPSIEKSIKVSNDGKYLAYWIHDCTGETGFLVICSVDRKWEIKIRQDRWGAFFFTHDGKKAITTLDNDSIGVLTLGNKQWHYLSQVKNLMFSTDENEDWIAYTTNPGGNDCCIVQNLNSGKPYRFLGVTKYLFSETGTALVLESKSGDNNSVIWFDLKKREAKVIATGGYFSHFQFDKTGNQLIFLSNEVKNDYNGYQLWYYKAGSERVNSIATKDGKGIDSGYSIADKDLNFSWDGRTIYFRVWKKSLNPDRDVAKNGIVNIWHYKDELLQPRQIFFHNNNYYYTDSILSCAINLNSKNIVVLGKASEVVLLNNNGPNNRYVLVYAAHHPDSYYNEESRPTLFIESVADGSRKILRKHFINANYPVNEPILSPNEEFVIWFDKDSLCYYSFEITTGITHNLSKKILAVLYDGEAIRIGRKYAFGIGGWLNGGETILLYDAHDIWKVDLKGDKPPENMSKFAGAKQNIVLGVIHPGAVALSSPYNADLSSFLPYKKGILLSGFNRQTKQNSFWAFDTTGMTGAQLCTASNDAYWIERNGMAGTDRPQSVCQPVKAKNADVYVVGKMNGREAPNFFTTVDFKNFKRVSDVYPERRYNWLTAELVSWKMNDGKVSQGILYKPEDFDSSKKYPVILHYYEEKSDELNNYITPGFSHDELNIPTFVSNGYIVFIPDIHYEIRHAGKSVINAVVSAAKYISSFPWVDKTKMGLQGHSFGGWETNFLITHSQLFAAACESSGMSDMVSCFEQPGYNGANRQEIYELYQGFYGLGATPWTDPEAYIENSPIFNVGSITTPLLMAHGEKDESVPFEQAVELFAAMKRAGKKVWLLDYDYANHGFLGKAGNDYTIRMQQFFDHYLKGAPAPRWMVKGIPAVMRGIDNGYELMPGSEL